MRTQRAIISCFPAWSVVLHYSYVLCYHLQYRLSNVLINLLSVLARCFGLLPDKSSCVPSSALFDSLYHNK